MNKRIICILVLLCLLLSIFPVCSMADDTEIEKNAEIESPNSTRTDNYATIIMQGNTIDAADCVAFENWLAASGNGYNTFARYGWSNNIITPNQVRVAESEFQTCRLYHVATIPATVEHIGMTLQTF